MPLACPPPQVRTDRFEGGLFRTSSQMRPTHVLDFLTPHVLPFPLLSCKQTQNKQPQQPKKKGGNRPKKEKNASALTILLPKTPFSQHLNDAIQEPELQLCWRSIDLYNCLSSLAAKVGAKCFVLHDTNVSDSCCLMCLAKTELTA